MHNKIQILKAQLEDIETSIRLTQVDIGFLKKEITKEEDKLISYKEKQRTIKDELKVLDSGCGV